MENYKFLSKIKWLMHALDEQIKILTISINSFNNQEKKIPYYLVSTNYKNYQTGKMLIKEANDRLNKMFLDNQHSNLYLKVINERYILRSISYFEDSYLIFNEYRKYSSKDILISKITSEFRILFMYIKEISDVLKNIRA